MDVENDTDGLIHAVALDGRGGGEDLTWGQLTQRLAAGGLPVWVHVDYSSEYVRHWLHEHSGLNPFICNILLSEDTRPVVRDYGDGMLVIMRGVNLNPGADPEDMVAIRVWVQSDRIISARKRRLVSTADLYEDLQSGVGPKNAGEFIVLLAERLEENIGPAVDDLDEVIDAAEGRLQESGTVSSYSGEFTAIRRQAASLRRYLAPQRDALEQMSRQPNQILNQAHCLRLREETDKLTRYLEDLDLVRERSIVAQEELLSRLALEQNSRIYVLSIVAAVFLPLSFLTGLWGMNVAGLPGTENPMSFWRVVALLLACAGVILAIFKIKKWF